MTTQDIQTLYSKVEDYVEKNFKKTSTPDSIEIESDGSIIVKWSEYMGCGDWEYTSETITVEQLFENN